MRIPLLSDEMMEDYESEDVLDLDDTHVGNFLDVNYEMVDGDPDAVFYDALDSAYNELFDEIEFQEMLEELEGMDDHEVEMALLPGLEA